MGIISTSDGRICFRKDDYVSHQIGDGGILGSNEIAIYTKQGTPYYLGMIFRFNNREDAIKASKEIIDQLRNNKSN